MKFLLIQPLVGSPQYVSVDDEDVPHIVDQFATSDVLEVTDVKSGSTTSFNMGNVAFMTVKDHKDNA